MTNTTLGEWWTKTAWPWLRTHWYLLPFAPLLLFIAVMSFARRNNGAVVEPLREADEKAKEEAAMREAAGAAEEAKLKERIAALQVENAAAQSQIEAELTQDAEELKGDPEKIRDAMLRAGRGGQ